MKKFLLSISILLCAYTCKAQDSTPFSNAPSIKRLDGSTISAKDIDGTVERLLHDGKVTGAGIAILNDGKVVYLKGHGFRNVKDALPLTPDTVMSGASLTKVAFAYMVMQLVQEGALDLDKPIYQYLPKPLPEYDNYKDLVGDPRYKKITSRMLLAHTTGLPNWRWFEDDKKLKIHFEPGAKFAYSGEGIYLLQFVVETITKTPLQELMTARVFQPLRMTRSSMVWEPAFETNFADGYDEQGQSLGSQRRKKAQSAGSLLTTPADFSKFIEAVLQGQALRKETRDVMLSPQIRIFSKHGFPPFAPETTTDNDAIRLSYGLAWVCIGRPTAKPSSKKATTTAGATTPSASMNPKSASSS
jgi:CubicO group peptidase (beta-lactamase class C family)